MTHQAETEANALATYAHITGNAALTTPQKNTSIGLTRTRFAALLIAAYAADTAQIEADIAALTPLTAVPAPTPAQNFSRPSALVGLYYRKA